MKPKVAVTLAIVTLLIAGCGGSSSSSGSSDDTSYRSGTQGIELSLPANSPTRFIENADGETINDEEMIIELVNKGAYPQPDQETAGELRIWSGGYDTKLLEITSEGTNLADEEGLNLGKITDYPQLEGKTPYNPQGGRHQIIINIHANDLPEGVNSYNPTIKFAVSNRYETVASQVICFDPRPRGAGSLEKSCKFTESIDLSSQGAPISVTRIEQDVTGSSTGKALYRIYFENKGSGTVLNFGGGSGGSDPISNNPFTKGYRLGELDKITVVEFSVGGVTLNDENEDAWECRPGINPAEVKLIDNKGVLFCEIFDKNSIGNQAIETPVTIIMQYGYTNSISHQVKIEAE